MEAVNGQWSTLYASLGSLFQAQGKCETISYIHYRLHKCKNSGSIDDHKSWSMAATSHEGRPFRRQKFPRMLSQEFFGRPARLRPQGFQCKTRLSHQWSGSNFGFWLCACMSKGSPLWGAGNVRPKRQRVEQNFTKSSVNGIHNAGSWARLYHWPHCWNRVYATSLLVQSWRGYPRVRAPVGFQSSTRSTHRFEGKFATCIANCQWCLRHCSFNPCCCASATAFPCQWCRMSCQGAFHSTKFGGPTIIRRILR